MSTLDDIVSLTEELITIKSIPDHPEELRRALALALSRLEGFTIERFERNGVESALVYAAPQRPESFELILNGHLDVIPGKDEQYVPRREGSRLYGVGSMDMKANVACLITAFADTAAEVDYPLALQLVTDEELGGFDGTKLQVEEGVRGRFVLAGEPTNFDIVHKAKGVLWLRVTATGTTAHGAYPWRGDNAAWKIHSFLESVHDRFPIPVEEVWETTANLSFISTENDTFNKVPDSCVVGLDIRYVPEEGDTLLSEVETLLPEGCTLSVLANEPALSTPEHNEHITLLQEACRAELGDVATLRPANGSSDARHYQGVGCPGIEFGPVGGGIGSDDEWVDIPSLERFHAVLTKFIRALPHTAAR